MSHLGDFEEFEANAEGEAAVMHLIAAFEQVIVGTAPGV